MKLAYYFIITFGFFTLTNALGFHGFHFKGLVEEPRRIENRMIDEKWFEEPLDHFNHRDNRTWNMVRIYICIYTSQINICI